MDWLDSLGQLSFILVVGISFAVLFISVTKQSFTPIIALKGIVVALVVYYFVPAIRAIKRVWKR